jgi:uncharacterized protein YbbC (DUF1343 family)
MQLLKWLIPIDHMISVSIAFSKEGRQAVISRHVQTKQSCFLFWQVQFIVYNKIIVIQMRFWRRNAQWPCEY